MTVFLLKDIANELELITDDPEERFITSSVSWEQYEEILVKLGDRPRYRVTYGEGVLEIMSPSRRHEVSKKNISRLLEVYFEETRTPFWGLGSTTFRQPEKKGGTEPDECYCINEEKELPDLAIEVVLTSGGIDKLAVYKKLNIREIWFWQNNQFDIYQLCSEEYKKIPKSELLPDLDLTMLAEYVVNPDPLSALLEFREKIRQQIQPS